MKLTYIPCSLRAEKITSHKECYVELLEEHVFYRLEFIADLLKNTEDPMLGSEEIHTFFDCRAKKSSINAIEIEITREGNWCITLYILGSARDLTVYFPNDDEKKAFQMYETIYKWWTSK